MVRKLESEGLFKDEHKKALPPYPQRICIVTSESGAAVHDITDSIWERWPCVKLALYPTAVQGEEAAEEIADVIRDINKRNDKLKFDLLIVGRGGGSMEDLWAFNEEVLARAIFDSKIPIVSAVGHEIDTTVADLVADVRASTPTKAGMFAVPDTDEIIAELERFKKDLINHMQWKVQLGTQRLDELSFGLCDSIKDMSNQVRDKLQLFYEKLLGIEPHRLIGKKAVELKTITGRMESAIRSTLNRKQLQLAASENRLIALNPKSVLKRGYSITTDKKTGSVIKEPQDVSLGSEIVTELAGEKRIESKVIKK
jgi:exodeoxyribonuclease VII large subunit